MQSSTLFDLWIRFHFDTKFTFMTDNLTSVSIENLYVFHFNMTVSKNTHIKMLPLKKLKTKKPSQAYILLHPRGTCVLSFCLLLRLSLAPLPYCVSGSSSVLTFFQFCGYRKSFFYIYTYLIPLHHSIVWDSSHVQSLKIRVEQQTDEVFLLMSSVKSPGCCVGVECTDQWCFCCSESRSCEIFSSVAVFSLSLFNIIKNSLFFFFFLHVL